MLINIPSNWAVRSWLSGSGWREDEKAATRKTRGGTWPGHLPVAEAQGTPLNTAWRDAASPASCCGCLLGFTAVPSLTSLGSSVAAHFPRRFSTRSFKSYLSIFWISYLALSRRWHFTFKWETTWTDSVSRYSWVSSQFLSRPLCTDRELDELLKGVLSAFWVLREPRKKWYQFITTTKCVISDMLGTVSAT